MILGLIEENNEAMMAGKVSKFRGNAVQFSRPFNLFRFELPFERNEGLLGRSNPRSSRYFCFQNHVLHPCISNYLARHTTSSRASLVYSVYSILDVKPSIVLLWFF